MNTFLPYPDFRVTAKAYETRTEPNHMKAEQ